MRWQWLTERTGWNEWLGRYKYVLLVVLAGVLLMLLPEGGNEEARVERGAEQAAFNLERMEEKLEAALSCIQGAGEVTVVLTLKESERQVLARDTQQSDREQSSTTVILSRGSGVEEAVALHRVYPTYQGALVVCGGAEDARVRLQITQAVRALTGLGAEKISVCKGQ